MYVDKLTLLWDAAALTSSAVSTNSIDLGAAGNDVSIGEPLALVIQVDVAADFTTGNETYAFYVINDTAQDLATSATTVISRTILYSDLTAGKIHVIPIPPGSLSKRYLGAGYTGGGTTPTITVTAWITSMDMIQRDAFYADAVTISG